MNELIQALAALHPPIDGDPSQFLERPWKGGWREFLVGSCKGIYRVEGKQYQILAALHPKPGNGHFSKALEWFENSARRDGYSLAFLEVENPELRARLKTRGYHEEENNLVKIQP